MSGVGEGIDEGVGVGEGVGVRAGGGLSEGEGAAVVGFRIGVGEDAGCLLSRLCVPYITVLKTKAVNTTMTTARFLFFMFPHCNINAHGGF
jgi:hypothetical protein